ncbi:hypothetical protein [Streptomyces sp. TRM68367]|uniref:hypothetical protein n=1 Tax=Streptomyces sp. TRM68367 TaxID=2758415 RepID=UPI001CA7EC21|nr:hypothetical protein [Streptomyces sp. TRM68367]
MQTRPRSPQPPGDPRWVAMFYQSSSASWRVGAQAPHRAPVLYAVGEMAQALRARGDEVTVDLWGPDNGAWQRVEASAAATEATVPTAQQAPSGAREPSKLAERMHDRRHQVLMAGLSKAGLYDLTPDDETAVRTLVDTLDETTVRRVAHWLSAAGSA